MQRPPWPHLLAPGHVREVERLGSGGSAEGSRRRPMHRGPSSAQVLRLRDTSAGWGARLLALRWGTGTTQPHHLLLISDLISAKMV